MPTKYFRGADFNEKGELVTKPSFSYGPAFTKQEDLYKKYFDSMPPIKYEPYPAFAHAKPVVGYKSNELDKMPEDHFTDLAKRVKLEADRRELEKAKEQALIKARYTQFSNFLLGVSQAMACRAALRWSKGLRPFSPDGQGSGKTPTSGEMWNIYDVAALGQELLAGATINRQPLKDGNTYLINANPLVWDMSGQALVAKAWLRPSSLMHYHYGSRFCAYRGTELKCGAPLGF